MGRPKKGSVVKKNANEPVQVEVKPVEEEEVDDLELQLRIVNLVCDAVDQEVKSRSAAIAAIGDGHMASASAQLQLIMSKFPEHIRQMPMKKFLKQHCPNTEGNTLSDGTLHFDPVQDPAFTIGRVHPPNGGLHDFSTGFASVQNTPGFRPSQTMKEHDGEGISNQLAGQDIEQLGWDEFPSAYRMQSAMKAPSAWDTPSLRTPGMDCKDTMVTRMTKKTTLQC